MSMTLMGLVFWSLSFLFFQRPQRLLELVLIGSIFQAAAVLVLGGLGIQPSMAPGLLFMAFIGLQLILGAKFPNANPSLRFCIPLFMTGLWTLASSIIMPRIFENDVLVWPQKLDAVGTRVPLAPNHGNFTQDAYLILNLVMLIFTICFLMRKEADARRLYMAYLMSGALVCFFGFWQMGHRLIGSIPFPKDFLYSNPGWAVLDTQMSGPVPRINSTFSEPSACAGALAGILYSTVWCTLRGYGGWSTRAMMAASALCMLMTTSTTGYMAVGIGLGLLIAYALISHSQRLFRRLMAFILGGIFCFGVATVALSAFAPDVIKAAGRVMVETQDKKHSSSYEERSQKDADSMQLVTDTYGLGTGWGSNRSSSLLPGFLSTMGVIGVLGLAIWDWRVLYSTIQALRSPAAQIDRTNAWLVEGTLSALLGRIISTVISGPVLGTLDLYVLVAILVTSIFKLRAAQKTQEGQLRFA